jgi:hypothetical protein
MGQKYFYSPGYQSVQILSRCVTSDTTIFMSSRNEKKQTIQFNIIPLIPCLERVQIESL